MQTQLVTVNDAPFQDVVAKAIALEELNTRNYQYKNKPNYHKKTNFNRVNEKLSQQPASLAKADTPNREIKNNPEIICFKCHKPGHKRKDCPELKRNGKVDKDLTITNGISTDLGDFYEFYGNVAGIELKIIVDTGAQANLMRRSVADSLPGSAIKSKSAAKERNLTSVHGERFKLICELLLTISTSNGSIDIPVIVVDDEPFPGDILLGADFLRRQKFN
jgi:hypothetical protein